MITGQVIFLRNKEFFWTELGLADVTDNFEMRSTIMKKLTLSTAAIIAVAGVLASASANAEHNAGGRSSRATSASLT
jgi:ribosomal protein L22